MPGNPNPKGHRLTPEEMAEGRKVAGVARRQRKRERDLAVEVLRRAVKRVMDPDTRKPMGYQKFLENLMLAGAKAALAGDVRAWIELTSRVFGPVRKEVALVGGDGPPVKLVIVERTNGNGNPTE